MRRVLPLVVCSLVFALTACSGDDDTLDVRPASPPDTNTAAPTTSPPSTTAPETTTTLPPPDLDAVSIELQEVASGLDSPVAMAFRAGDDRPYLAEQPGAVRVMVDGAPADPAVLEVDVSHDNEQGLLGLAFSNDGTKLYVDYTDPRGDTHVNEYTMNGDVADPSSRRELLFVDQPFANHNGGQLVVGPDNMLYIALGDGGAGGDTLEAGQNRSLLLAKILRIDPNGDPYSIPADNPFVGDADARPEVWMYGLRNPWRFTFDRANGDVWIADVGQNAWEEIDYAPAGEGAGANWGWDEREGFHAYEGDPPPGARDPIAEFPNGEYSAIIGGYAYRGSAIPSLNGVYLYSDNCKGELEAIVQENGAVVDQRELGIHVDQPTTFGEDADGEVYVVSRTGTFYKLVSA